MNITSEIVIHKQPEEIFNLYINNQGVQDWYIGLKSFKIIINNENLLGNENELTLKFLFKEIIIREIITEINFPDYIEKTYEIKPNEFFATAKLKVIRLDNFKSRLVCKVYYKPKGFMRLIQFFAPFLIRFRLRKILFNFKEFIEDTKIS